MKGNIKIIQCQICGIQKETIAKRHCIRHCGLRMHVVNWKKVKD